jgi:hypothetical protein
VTRRKTAKKKKMGRPEKEPFSAWHAFVDRVQTAFDVTQLVRAMRNPEQRARIIKEMTLDDPNDDGKSARMFWYWQDRFKAHQEAGLKERGAKHAANEDTEREFGVSSTYIQRIRREIAKRLQQCEVFVKTNVDPQLGFHHFSIQFLKQAEDVMRSDALYGGLLRPDALWGPGLAPGQQMPAAPPATPTQIHTYAQAFLLAHQARQTAERRVSELEATVKQLNTIRGKVGLSTSANSAKDR